MSETLNANFRRKQTPKTEIEKVNTTKQEVCEADRKKGLTLLQRVLRGSFKMEKPEKTRVRKRWGRRSRVRRPRNENWPTERVQSGGHSGWWVIYSTERLVG